jgi:hypothetical protein
MRELGLFFRIQELSFHAGQNRQYPFLFSDILLHIITIIIIIVFAVVVVVIVTTTTITTSATITLKVIGAWRH